jgi:hypothetical protein
LSILCALLKQEFLKHLKEFGSDLAARCGLDLDLKDYLSIKSKPSALFNLFDLIILSHRFCATINVRFGRREVSTARKEGIAGMTMVTLDRMTSIRWQGEGQWHSRRHWTITCFEYSDPNSLLGEIRALSLGELVPQAMAFEDPISMPQFHDGVAIPRWSYSCIREHLQHPMQKSKAILKGWKKKGDDSIPTVGIPLQCESVFNVTYPLPHTSSLVHFGDSEKEQQAKYVLRCLSNPAYLCANTCTDQKPKTIPDEGFFFVHEGKIPDSVVKALDSLKITALLKSGLKAVYLKDLGEGKVVKELRSWIQTDQVRRSTSAGPLKGYKLREDSVMVIRGQSRQGRIRTFNISITPC